LNTPGRLAIVLPHGVLFRGGSEAGIRAGILKDDILEAIVGLPSKLFYNTGIPAAVWVVDKAKRPELKNKVVFIDASRQFKEGKNQNLLEEEHIQAIVAAYDGLKDVDRFMRIVDMGEIAENDYNLNIARYIDTADQEEAVDIQGTVESLRQLDEKETEIDARLNGFLKELGFS